MNPVAGPRFKAVCELKRPLAHDDRRVLALIAAYADAGEQSPPMTELAARLNLTPEEIDASLERLSRGRRRLLWIDWAPFKLYGADTHGTARSIRNRYTLLLPGEPLPEHAREVLERAAEKRRVTQTTSEVPTHGK